MDCFRITLWTSCHSTHSWEHATELLLKLNKFDNTLLQNLWEVKESESMSSWSCIKDDHVKVVLVQASQDLTEWSCFIDSWNWAHNLRHETFTLLLHFFSHAFHGVSRATSCKSTKHASSIFRLSIGVNLHRIQVFESLNLSRFTAKLLIKRVT